jgi:HlyD family secretion protein
MTRRRRTKLWVRATALVLLIAGSAFAVRQIRRTRAVVDLPVAPARKGIFSVLVPCRGELSARRSIQLTAPLDIPDLQIVWLAPAGDAVKPGMPVIRFDPSRLQQELNEKSAAFRQAQATLDQAVAQARITADQDNLDLATARYQMERARLEASKQAIISAMEGQKSVVDLGLAEEKVRLQQATAEFHKSSDEAKIASLRRLRDEAKAEVDRTERRLTLMEIKSPLNGVINYLPNTSQGWMNAQPFKVGDHASAGLAIAEIPDLATLEMESKVDEVDRGAHHDWRCRHGTCGCFSGKGIDGKAGFHLATHRTELYGVAANEKLQSLCTHSSARLAHAARDECWCRRRRDQNSGCDQHPGEGAVYASRQACRLSEVERAVYASAGSGARPKYG